MDNVEIYKRAKFQLKIPYNIGCAKITKPDIRSSVRMEFWLPSSNELDIWTIKASVEITECVRTHKAASWQK
jgi:hypothetical protein